MSNNKIAFKHEFLGAGASPAVVTPGPSLLMQTSGPTATLQGTNLPEIEASWQNLGQASGYTPLVVNTPFAYIRAVVAAACLVVVSAAGGAMPTSSGGGGGDTIPANTLTLNGEALTFNGEYLTFGA